MAITREQVNAALGKVNNPAVLETAIQSGTFATSQVIAANLRKMEEANQYVEKKRKDRKEKEALDASIDFYQKALLDPKNKEIRDIVIADPNSKDELKAFIKQGFTSPQQSIAALQKSIEGVRQLEKQTELTRTLSGIDFTSPDSVNKVIDMASEANIPLDSLASSIKSIKDIMPETTTVTVDQQLKAGNAIALDSANVAAENARVQGTPLSPAEYERVYISSGGIANSDFYGIIDKKVEQGTLSNVGTAEFKEAELEKKEAYKASVSSFQTLLGDVANANKAAENIRNTTDNGLVTIFQTGQLSSLNTPKAATIRGNLEVLKGISGLNKLSSLKQASSTGGSGLGNVSNVELLSLQSTEGGLALAQEGTQENLLQTVENYVYQLNRTIYDGIKNIIAEEGVDALENYDINQNIITELEDRLIASESSGNVDSIMNISGGKTVPANRTIDGGTDYQRIVIEDLKQVTQDTEFLKDKLPRIKELQKKIEDNTETEAEGQEYLELMEAYIKSPYGDQFMDILGFENSVVDENGNVVDIKNILPSERSAYQNVYGDVGVDQNELSDPVIISISPQ